MTWKYQNPAFAQLTGTENIKSTLHIKGVMVFLDMQSADDYRPTDLAYEADE
jgi:hypothetical protein